MWTVQLTYDAPGVGAQWRAAIARELGAATAYAESTGRFTLTFYVEAPTLRQAADVALRMAAGAVGGAGRGAKVGRPKQIRVLSSEDFLAEAAHPGAAEHMGIAEISALLGVSRQRVGQLITRKDFPAPVSRLAAGPVFTAASVEMFKALWEPGRRTGRPAGKPGEVEHDGAPRRAGERK